MRLKGHRSHLHNVLFDESRTCVICGSFNCSESVTHDKITLNQLKDQIFKHQYDQQPQIPLTSIKNQVKFKYQQLKCQICNIINQKQKQVQVWLNQFYFPKSYSKYKSFELIKQIMQNSYINLPNKSINKLKKQIFSSQQLIGPQGINQSLKDVVQKTKQFLYDLDVLEMIEHIGSKISLLQIKQKILPSIRLLPKRSISTSEGSNPQECQPITNKIYEWAEKRIKISKSTRVLQLSNKLISDQEVIEQLPIIASYRNIQELQLRNNKISSLTCNIIANNFSFLKVVDIRSNKTIDDKGIIKIINGIPNLKSLFISQTQATDQSGVQVCRKLPQLQVFWCEHTKISGQVGIKIADKAKLKVLSLYGNPIEQDFKIKIKQIMNPKGYIVI